MRVRKAVAVALGVAALGAGVLANAAAPRRAAADVARGKYVFGAAGGCGCHTETKGPVNAGGRRYDGPFGTVYSTNITPDPETGIGRWTDEEVVTAIRAGRRPNGERLLPVHPYPVFNGMAAEDLRALVAYLRTLPPVRRANRPRRITVPFFESVFLPAWLAAFSPRERPPAAAPTGGPDRGEYLVRAVAHCGECHTPRTLTMAPDTARFLAGTPNGPENSSVPNITPDRDTGIGTWSEQDIAWYLRTGNRPDGDVAGGLMGEVIQGTTAGYKDLTRDDLAAIARYLKSIPAVRNRVERKR